MIEFMLVDMGPLFYRSQNGRTDGINESNRVSLLRRSGLEVQSQTCVRVRSYDTGVIVFHARPIVNMIIIAPSVGPSVPFLLFCFHKVVDP
jgi:hypothetical protein